MNIATERLILRAIEDVDCAALLELVNDGETEYSLGGWSFPVSVQQQRDWIASQKGRADLLRCMISDKKKPDDVFGTAILSDIDYKNGTAEIHIKLLKKARGKGIGRETIQALVQYAFNELRLHCIYALVNEDNSPSQRMFHACGFEQEGTLKGRLYKRGHYLNIVSFSITAEHV